MCTYLQTLQAVVSMIHTANSITISGKSQLLRGC